MGDFTQDEMDDESGLTEQGEGREVKVIKDPGLPSKEEYERHRTNHTPYATWCKHCLVTRAIRHAPPSKGRKAVVVPDTESRNTGRYGTRNRKYEKIEGYATRHRE